jgi:hypothetical protein
VQVADVREQIALSLFGDFVDFDDFAPRAHQEGAVTAMLDQVVTWGGALKPLRVNPPATNGRHDDGVAASAVPA